MSRRSARRAPQRAAPSRPEPIQDDLDEDFEDEGPEDDLDGNAYEDDEDGPEPLECTNADDFFAAEVSKVRPAVLRLYGETHTLPTTVPLAFTLLTERHAGDDTIESFRTVLAPVFGEDALDHWLASGMDARQLSIVLIWSAQNMQHPGSLSFADAAKTLDERQARGKALPNRAARRAGSGGRSSSTGGSSKRTSAASTS